VYIKTENKFVAREVQVVARNADEVAVTGLNKGMAVSLTDLGDAGGADASKKDTVAKKGQS
jgi:hypothetical protein